MSEPLTSPAPADLIGPGCLPTALFYLLSYLDADGHNSYAFGVRGAGDIGSLVGQIAAAQHSLVHSMFDTESDLPGGSK